MATYQRWKSQYSGVKKDALKRLKELEKENTRLKRLVVDQALDMANELLLIPAKMIPKRRRKIVKLAVSNKFASFLKQAYQRLEQWLSQTAPQLNLATGQFPSWPLFDPAQATPSATT
ncbi:MAG: hypothetical protein HC845_04770 [Akkermansiaceae bacterium]|nr:hypothetical protein [Akkermansiaceae bacterium]